MNQADKDELSKIEREIKEWVPLAEDGMPKSLLYKFLIGRALLRAEQIFAIDQTLKGPPHG